MKKKEEMEITNELIEAVKSKKTFTEIGINEQLVKAVTELGYTHATEIQERSIPVLISGTKDFIGLAQTGTGKTAAFGLPLLQLIKTTDKFPPAAWEESSSIGVSVRIPQQSSERESLEAAGLSY